MCWGVGEVRKGEGSEEMWGSVLGPHTLTHFTTPPPVLPLTPTHFPTHPIHFPTLLHSPHIFSYSSPHPNTLPYTSFHSSPYTPTHFPTHPMHSPHIFPHSLDYVAKLPSDDVALINLIGLWKSPIKFFTTTGNLKSCFGVGKVNFRCMKVWRSYHVAKLQWQSYHVAKLPRGKVTGNLFNHLVTGLKVP